MHSSVKLLFLLGLILVAAWLVFPSVFAPEDIEKETAGSEIAPANIEPAPEPFPHPPAPEIMLFAALPFDPPQSSWFDAEKKLYSRMLERSTYDYLVIPVQVQDYAIDSSGRKLMTYYLANRIGQRTGGSVANPAVVSRALGNPLRVWDRDSIYAVTWKSRPKALISAYVGHDVLGNMSITIGVQRPDAHNIIDKNSKIEYETRTGLKFSDEVLPSDRFLEVLDDMLTDLPLDLNAAPSPTLLTSAAALELPALPGVVGAPVEAIPDEMPVPDVELAPIEKPTATEKAWLLQWYGVLYPPSSHNGFSEELFARSLTLLMDVTGNSTDAHLLRARALFYLNRRPAAVAILSSPASAEEKAFRAYMDGNLPDLEKWTALIERPLARLMADLELLDLSFSYREPDPTEAELLPYAERSKSWSLLFMRKVANKDSWKQQHNLEIKLALDAAFPVSGYSAIDIIGSQLAMQDNLSEFGEIDLSVLTHTRKLLEAISGVPGDIIAPGDYDYLNLLYSLAEANLIQSVDFLNKVQGQPERAMELLDKLAKVYRGHPQMALRRAQILKGALKSADPTLADGLRSEIESNAEVAFYWSPGQTWTSMHVSSLLGVYKGGGVPTYAPDFPRRWYWYGKGIGLGTLASFVSRNSGVKPELPSSQENALAYTYDRTTYLEKLVKITRKPELLKKIIEENKNRFIGHPNRHKYMVAVLKREGDIDGLRLVYEEAIATNPNVWSIYEQYADLEIEQLNYKAASDIFLRYPGFQRDSGENRVGVSNNSYLAGLKFFLLGEAELAIPLLQISADLDTGSGGSIGAKIYLALLEENYAGAADHAMTRARRYSQNPFPFNELLSLWHVAGKHEDAWSVFEQIKNRFQRPEEWTSAMVGHRSEGREIDSLGDWLMVNDKRKRSYTLASRYVVLHGVTDRVPKDLTDLLQSIEQAAGRLHPVEQCEGQKIYRRESGSTLFPHKDLSQVELQNGYDDAKLTCADRILYPSSYISEAYRFIAQEDYEAAFTLLRDAARYIGLGWEMFESPALPLFVWSATRSGHIDEVAKYLDLRKKDRFDTLLSRALLAGATEKHDDAVQYLRRAFSKRPYTDFRPIPTEYQVVEIAEWLYQASGEARYRALALDWSRRFQRVYPWMAWAYAVEAKYTDSDERRLRALAIALHLDKNSARIAHFSEEQKDAARKWFESNNPFARPVVDEAVDKTA